MKRDFFVLTRLKSLSGSPEDFRISDILLVFDKEPFCEHPLGMEASVNGLAYRNVTNNTQERHKNTYVTFAWKYILTESKPRS